MAFSNESLKAFLVAEAPCGFSKIQFYAGSGYVGQSRRALVSGKVAWKGAAGEGPWVPGGIMRQADPKRPAHGRASGLRAPQGG